MSAVFTFKLSDLFTGPTRSNHQWHWWGLCKAETGLFLELARSDHPKADLSVEPISEIDRIMREIVGNFGEEPATLKLQERLSAAQADGSADALILEHWAEREHWPERKGALGVTIGLRPQRYELFRTFVTLHFGRQDLKGRIQFPIREFAASQEGGLILPNEMEFLAGRPYLVVDDSSIAFSANPDAFS
jgi:hypothetical protein